MTGDIFVLEPARDGLGITLAILSCLFAGAATGILWVYTAYTKRLSDSTKELVKLTQDSLNEVRASSAAALAEAQRSYEATEKGNKIAADALAETRRSNESTETSNQIAKDSLEIGRRAWLLLLGVEARHEEINWDSASSAISKPSPFPFDIAVSFKNVGRVPATSLTARFYMKAVPVDEVIWPMEIIPARETRGAVTTLVVGPDETSSVTRRPDSWGASSPNDYDVKEALETHHGWRLFLHCEVSYGDIFKKEGGRISAAAWVCAAPPILGENVKWVPVAGYSRMD